MNNTLEGYFSRLCFPIRIFLSKEILQKDRKGEILLKGPSITKGYFKDAQKTAELFDVDGFLHTGDIGHLLPDGKLKIIDRKKHIFKLAQVIFLKL